MAGRITGGIGVELECEWENDYVSSVIQHLAVGSKVESIKSDSYHGNVVSKKPSGEASLYFEAQVGLLGDWRVNAAVIEAICERLSLEDLKAARRVCKAWATAGAVPISKKSKVTECTRAKNHRWLFSSPVYNQHPIRLYNGICLPRLKNILHFGNPKLFETGFLIRHLEVDWNLQDGTPWGTDRDVLKDWLEVLSSEEFKLLISLKFENCPSEVVCQLFIPYYLPTYWKELKFLQFSHSQLRRMKECRLDLPVQVITPTKLELETLEVDLLVSYGYDFGIFKYCSNLKNLKLGVAVHPCTSPTQVAIEDTYLKLQALYHQIEKMIEGKSISRLDLWHDFGCIQFCDKLASSWKTFFIHLVSSCRSSIEHFKLTTIAHSSVLNSLFDDFPAVCYLPRLKSSEFVCQADCQTFLNWRRRSFNELISVFSAKGYLGIANFELNLFLGGLENLTIVSENARRVILQSNFPVKDLLAYFSRDFSETMKEAYPGINYICSPSQTTTANNMPSSISTTATTIFERLGKEDVFDITTVIAEWNSLKLPKTPKLRVGEFDIHNCLEPFITNALTRIDGIPALERRWCDVLEKQNDRTILYFDTFENLNEVWEKAKDSTPSWSSVPPGFTPGVIVNDKESYVFARIFKTGSSDDAVRDRGNNSISWDVVPAIISLSKKLWKRITINK